MVVQERFYTAAEFWEIARRPENADKRLELIDGVIVEMPSSSQKNTVIAALIIYFLNNFVIPRNLGYVSGPDGGYTISPGNAFQPDAGFISRERHPTLEGVEFPMPPDLAVEVISPSESSSDVMKKIQRYIDAGTRLVWTVYPDEQTVYAWRAAPDGGLHVQSHNMNDILDGGEVLPGFAVKVSEIFPK